MARIEWHNGLNLGVKELDAQHRELIAMVNDVLEAFEKGETDTAVDRLLKQLHEYTVHHFNTEEKFMEKIDYPYVHEHRQLHAALKNKVKTLRAARFHYEEVTREEVKELLSKWLIEHILKADYKIAQFARGKGGDH